MDESGPAAPMPKFTCSVSKRHFKDAVSRNLLKRRMREAYRLNKAELYDKDREGQLEMMVVFTGKEMMEYASIEKSMKKVVKRIAK